MEGKLEKVSTNISRFKTRSLLRRFSIAVLIIGISLSCDSDLSDDAIPYTAFPDLVINLTQPSYNDLNTLGWMYFNDIGTRGVIVYKVNATTYRAFERNCSYRPNDACATVGVHSSNLYMEDACCGSIFSLSDGMPTNGPAWRNLRQYATFLSGSTLTVTDEVVQ
jgi:hypothetical protein